MAHRLTRRAWALAVLFMPLAALAQPVPGPDFIPLNRAIGAQQLVNTNGALVSTANPLAVTIAGGNVSTGGGGSSGGPTTVAVATSSAPSYTANSPAALSLDLSGNLRIVCVLNCGGGAVTQSGAWTVGLASGTLVGISGALPAGTNTIGTVQIGNFPATQPVSVASLPLPAGAATAAAQPALNADGGALVHLTNPVAVQPVSVSSLPLPAGAATAAAQPALNADGGALVHVVNTPSVQPVSGTVNVGNLPATQPVSANALPLPAGAATSAAQPALNGDGGGLAHVTNFPATQPVSGTVTIGGGSVGVSGPVAVSSLPALPTGGNTIGTVNVAGTVPTSAAVTSLVDRSGTISAASTAQALMPAGAARSGFFILASADVWISLTGTATGALGSGSWRLPAGVLFETPPNLRPVGAISIWSATAGATFTSQEW